VKENACGTRRGRRATKGQPSDRVIKTPFARVVRVEPDQWRWPSIDGEATRTSHCSEALLYESTVIARYLEAVDGRSCLRSAAAGIQRPSRSRNKPEARLRSEFIRVARRYGDRFGIEYATWREVGVDHSTLTAAGIHVPRLAERT